MKNKNFTEAIKLKSSSIEYKVNEENGTVVAIAKFIYPRALASAHKPVIKTKGVAKVNRSAGEVFDVNVGKRIARAKAEKEAFVQFKMVILNAQKRIVRVSSILNQTILAMNTYIQHQKNYIKSF